MFDHVVVLGGGVGGVLTAFALAPFAGAVTVAELDRFEAEPVPRRGAPQARHTHALVAGGARAMEALVPGVLAELSAAGAQHINMPGRYLALTARGWWPRFDGRQFIVGCTRGLLERTLRGRLRELANVRLVGGVQAVGLLGDRHRITGVRLREVAGGEPRELHGDLVVDATGRRSRGAEWLTELGFPAVSESIVDPGIFYASAVFQAPAEAGPEFPAITIQTSTRGELSVRRVGNLLPIENGQWMLTLSGGPGTRPSTEPEAFHAFARRLPHPVLADLIAAATPVGPPFGFRADANRRRHYDRLRPSPNGFLALGDAYATFNPVYGHGMSAAALAAHALHRQCQRRHPATAVLQRAIAEAATPAWNLATSQDLRYPQTLGPAPSRVDQAIARLVDRILAAGSHSPLITNAQAEVFTLSSPITALFRPRVLWHAGRRATGPVRADPPLTDQERRLLGTKRH